jgi:hypothetical protein
MTASIEKWVDCAVSVPEHLRIGEYANAFRVVPDGNQFFLDFVKYSPAEHTGEVVTRVRVKPDVIEMVRDRLNQTLLEIP